MAMAARDRLARTLRDLLEDYRLALRLASVA